MRGFLIELAKTGGKIAREHFRSHRVTATAKGRADYVSHVDRQVEDAIATRIRGHYPDHLVLGEEGLADQSGAATGPCWIIDPIDGTTNFIRGIAHFAISIAFCDANAEPRHGVIYDPIADEIFIGERNAGSWVGSERVYTSNCSQLDEAIIATALPFRHLEPLPDAVTALTALQRESDDFRRGGSAALDLAYVAAGRLDAYYELGIWSWDTAAGELLVRAAGGAATDFRNDTGKLLSRRSICAAASPALHQAIMERITALRPWADRPPFLESAQARTVVEGASDSPS